MPVPGRAYLGPYQVRAKILAPGTVYIIHSDILTGYGMLQHYLVLTTVPGITLVGPRDLPGTALPAGGTYRYQGTYHDSTRVRSSAPDVVIERNYSQESPKILLSTTPFLRYRNQPRRAPPRTTILLGY